MDISKNALPHWDLKNLFSGLDSPEFIESLGEVERLIDDLENYLGQNNIDRRNAINVKTEVLSDSMTEVINRLNEIFRKVNTLDNYLKSFITTDSYNNQAVSLYSQVQVQVVRAEQAKSTISGWLGGLGDELPKIISINPTAVDHAFFLQESAEQSKYLMKSSEESLANELSLSGIRAWGKLQGTITSQLSIDFEHDDEVQSIPLPALQNIRRYNPDSKVRENAFRAEIEALESVRESHWTKLGLIEKHWKQ
jgi:oligoendopeptidase F